MTNSTFASIIKEKKWETIDSSWKDDTRCNGHLFNPFRPTRDDNPPEWDDRMSFWMKMIIETNKLIADVKIERVKGLENDSKKSESGSASSSSSLAALKKTVHTSDVVFLDQLSPFTVSQKQLMERFQRQGRSPECLSTVLVRSMYIPIYLYMTYN